MVFCLVRVHTVLCTSVNKVAVLFLSGMLSQDFGHIVNISSLSGVLGSPMRTTYSASKFALHGLTYSLRYEVCE